MSLNKFKVWGFKSVDFPVLILAIQPSMADVLAKAQAEGVTIKHIIDLGKVPEEAGLSFEYDYGPEENLLDTASGDCTQMTEFDTFLALCVKFNPQLCTDDICDTICCENCPYNELAPANDPGSINECIPALCARLNQFRKEH